MIFDNLSSISRIFTDSRFKEKNKNPNISERNNLSEITGNFLSLFHFLSQREILTTTFK